MGYLSILMEILKGVDPSTCKFPNMWKIMKEPPLPNFIVYKHPITSVFSDSCSKDMEGCVWFFLLKTKCRFCNAKEISF